MCSSACSLVIRASVQIALVAPQCQADKVPYPPQVLSPAGICLEIRARTILNCGVCALPFVRIRFLDPYVDYTVAQLNAQLLCFDSIGDQSRAKLKLGDLDSALDICCKID